MSSKYGVAGVDARLRYARDSSMRSCMYASVCTFCGRDVSDEAVFMLHYSEQTLR